MERSHNLFLLGGNDLDYKKIIIFANDYNKYINAFIDINFRIVSQ